MIWRWSKMKGKLMINIWITTWLQALKLLGSFPLKENCISKSTNMKLRICLCRHGSENRVFSGFWGRFLSLKTEFNTNFCKFGSSMPRRWITWIKGIIWLSIVFGSKKTSLLCCVKWRKKWPLPNKLTIFPRKF